MFNTVDITPDQARSAVEFCHKLNTPVLLLGLPGIGKTETVREYAQDHNLEFIDIRLSLKDRGDFVIPFIDQEKERVKTYLTNLVPFDATPRIIFFDELTNAPGEIQKMIFSIVLERELEGRKLHPNTYVLAAGNAVEDGCNVYEVDPALMDRFTVLRVTHDVQGFLRRAIEKGAAPEVITFLKLKPGFIYGIDGKVPDGKYLYPTPRSWMVVSDMLKNKAEKPLQGILIPGRIGREAYTEFRYVLEELGNLPPIEDFFNAKTEKEILRLLKEVKTLNSVYGLVYSIVPVCKDLNTYLQALRIFNCMVQIKDSIPRNEIRAMGVELLSAKEMEVLGEDSIAFIASPEYEEYCSERDEMKKLIKK